MKLQKKTVTKTVLYENSCSHRRRLVAFGVPVQISPKLTQILNENEYHVWMCGKTKHVLFTKSLSSNKFLETNQPSKINSADLLSGNSGNVNRVFDWFRIIENLLHFHWVLD